MASLYKRTKRVGNKRVLTSPFWWVKFKHPDKFTRRPDGKIIHQVQREPTPFKIGVGADTRRAEELRATYTLREAKITTTVASEQWDLWVPDFFKLHYGDGQSLVRAKASWRTMRMYLAEQSIEVPRQLNRSLCLAFMKWRETPDPAIGKYKACPNTARSELKFLGIVMKEAVKRGFAEYNPCRELGIKQQAVKEKPAITPEVAETIREKIRSVEMPQADREFFHNSFEIAWHHGVRLSGTFLDPMTAVHVTEQGQWRITFTHKGKTRTKILHPKLIPLFTKLRAEKKTQTYEPQRSPAKKWWRFLTKHGIKTALPGVSFHSTRVTVATTLARKGISEKKAMEYIDHASTTVHRSYVRLHPEDLEECSDAIV